MENMIDVTDAEPIELVKAAYALSVPQGLGFMHATDGPLSDEQAQEILDREKPGGRIVASMDYVNGRACKMTIFHADGRRYIHPIWFDHSDSQLAELLETVGVAATT